jgi:methylmalonyl-CoA mutase cobalamin-binding subunit
MMERIAEASPRVQARIAGFLYLIVIVGGIIANQLYDDLRSKGVVCWFAPHDIRAGRKICEQVGDAIRRSDRV